MMTPVPSGRVAPAPPAQAAIAPGIGDLPTTAVMPPATALVPAIVAPPSNVALVDVSTQVVVADRTHPLRGAAPHVVTSMAGLTTIATLLTFDMTGPALLATGVTALVQATTLLAQHLKATRGSEKLARLPSLFSSRDDVDAILARFEAAARHHRAEGAEGGTSTSPETIEQLRKLGPFFEQQVSEASRWNTWPAEARSLQRALSFLADRVKPLDCRLAAVIANSIDEANAASREREQVEDILRPAAAYISARLQTGPVAPREDLRQIGVMFDTKVGEAMRWNKWPAEAESLRRAFCYTLPLVAQYDPALAAFMKKSVAEADAASGWRERVEDVLRPAAAYVSRTLKGID